MAYKTYKQPTLNINGITVHPHCPHPTLRNNPTSTWKPKDRRRRSKLQHTHCVYTMTMNNSNKKHKEKEQTNKQI